VGREQWKGGAPAVETAPKGWRHEVRLRGLGTGASGGRPRSWARPFPTKEGDWWVMAIYSLGYSLGHSPGFGWGVGCAVDSGRVG
jgi:hypothetical protein